LSKLTFVFGPKPFVFVYSGAKLVHFKEISIAKCNTNVRKCNLFKNDRNRKEGTNRRLTPSNKRMIKRYLSLYELLSVLNNEALIAIINTLTSKVVDLAIAHLFSLHSRDASSRISLLTHQGYIVNIVPTLL